MNKFFKKVKEIPCFFGLHWWSYGYKMLPTEEELILLPGIEQIVEEFIHDRKCVFCGKHEVLSHSVWNYGKRRFDIFKDKWLKINV